MFFESKVVSAPLLLQQRVTKDSCKVHQLFKETILECYGQLNSANEYTGVLGKRWNYSLPHGGYSHLLPRTQDEAVELLNSLRSGNWLNRGTRYIALQLTVYNANVNLFCIAKIEFTFPSSGMLFYHS